MITNRLSLLVAAAVALISTTALAQDDKPGKPGQDAKQGQDAKPVRESRDHRRGGGMNPKSLEKALNLTPEQTEKLKPTFKKFADTRKKLSEGTTADPKAKREQTMAAMKDLMKSVEEVLTPEQKAKFDEIKKKMEEAAKNRKAKTTKDGSNN